MRKPSFADLLQVLHNEVPSRPTLFELFLNDTYYRHFAGEGSVSINDKWTHLRLVVHGFWGAGYDYATVHASDFHFPQGEVLSRQTRSLNQGALISDWESFRKYPWPDPASYDYTRLERINDELPEGMKLIVMGPGGVLENVITLVGFDHLCYLLVDDPELVQAVFDAVGSRLLGYYEIAARFDSVGALISNDDWGFKSQTMLSPADMRRLVFPWHKRIVQTIHRAGKPAILHSCGNLEQVMDDIIDDMGYDAKHSFEDTILPVEEAYERWGDRIAILGGIDMDFLCRATPQEIQARSLAMLERAKGRGGYALGSGNSIPEYVPLKNYLAMTSAALG